MILLGLGSNLGDREAWLRRALAELESRDVKVVRESSLYETAPVGYLGQPDFLNQVCEVQWRQSPLHLLEACAGVENELGRQRQVDQGPRNIDIDILYYHDRIVRTRQIQVPHPRIAERAFVLVPLEELAPDFVDPLSGLSIREMRRVCPDRSRVERWSVGGGN